MSPESESRATDLRLIQLACSAALAEIVVIPAGKVDSKNGTMMVDEEAFSAIVAKFDEHGTDVPIDYEHQSLGGKYASPDGTAPAAGWIKSLRFDPKAGVIASVEWTERGRAAIRSGEYGYLSPVCLVRKDDLRPVALHSVGLTNKPAIANLERLVAKENFMAATKTQPNQEPVTGADPMMALARIAGELGLEDVANEAGAIAEAVLAKIREMKATDADDGGDDTEAAANKETVAKIAKRLGCDADCNVIVAKLDELRANRVDPDKIDALQTELKALKDAELNRTVDAAIKTAIDAGKLNPNDADDLKYWRAVCTENPDHFARIMAKAPKVWPGPGADVTTPAGKQDARAARIKELSDEWTANREHEHVRGTSKWAFVQASLQLADEPGLTPDEKKALAAG